MIRFCSILSFLFFISCSDTSSNSEKLKEVDIPKDTIVTEVLEEEFANEMFLNGDKWEINDYASEILSEPIASDMDQANDNEWFYDWLDIPAGYVTVRGPIEGWHEFVLWRMDNGKDLVIQMTVGCGPACDYTFAFYEGNGLKVEPVSPQDYIPVAELESQKDEMVKKALLDFTVDYPEDSQIVYNLPQEGTSIQVDVVIGADEIRFPLAMLGWDGMSFYILEKFEEVKPSYN